MDQQKKFSVDAVAQVQHFLEQVPPYEAHQLVVIRATSGELSKELNDRRANAADLRAPVEVP
jgi:hypothetical protein